MSRRRRAVVALMAATVVIAASIFTYQHFNRGPATGPTGETATLWIYSGSVSLTRFHGAGQTVVGSGSRVGTGDRLTTSADGRTELRWPDGSVIRLDFDTALTINSVSAMGKAGFATDLTQSTGQTWTKLPATSSSRLSGPNATSLSSEGGEFFMAVDVVAGIPEVRAGAYAGTADVGNKKGTVTLGAGETTGVSASSAPPPASPLPAAALMSGWTIFNLAADHAPDGASGLNEQHSAITPGETTPLAPAVTNHVAADLQLTLGWAGSTLRLQIFKDGKPFRDLTSSTPPFDVLIPGAEPASWSYQVTDLSSAGQENWVLITFVTTPSTFPAVPFFAENGSCSQTVRAGTRDTLTVGARDAAGTPVLTAEGMASYAGLSDNGDGSATITVAPPAASPAADFTSVVTASLEGQSASLVCDIHVLAATSSTLSGEVTGSGSGSVVILSGPLALTTKTDASGSYVFRDLPAGLYAVTLTVPHGYAALSPTSTDVQLDGIASATANFAILRDLAISGPAEAARLATPYSSGLSAVGGAPPYRFTMTSGSLPRGLRFDSTTGRIAGSPTRAGSMSFTGVVTDSAGRTATATFVIGVTAPSAGSVLLLGSTLFDPTCWWYQRTAGCVPDLTNSYEYRATVAAGKPATIVDAGTFRDLTAAEFEAFDAIVLGDPGIAEHYQDNPASYAAAFQPALDNPAWGAALGGNVIIMGNAYSDWIARHQTPSSGQPFPAIRSAITFADATHGRTGAYISLGAWGTAAQVLLDLVEPGLTLTPTSLLPHPYSAAENPLISLGVNDPNLQDWTPLDGFAAWPADFSVVAFDDSGTGQGPYLAPNGLHGYPYIVERGVTMTLGAGTAAQVRWQTYDNTGSKALPVNSMAPFPMSLMAADKYGNWTGGTFALTTSDPDPAVSLNGNGSLTIDYPKSMGGAEAEYSLRTPGSQTVTASGYGVEATTDVYVYPAAFEVRFSPPGTPTFTASYEEVHSLTVEVAPLDANGGYLCDFASSWPVSASAPVYFHFSVQGGRLISSSPAAFTSPVSCPVGLATFDQAEETFAVSATFFRAGSQSISAVIEFFDHQGAPPGQPFPEYPHAAVTVLPGPVARYEVVYPPASPVQVGHIASLEVIGYDAYNNFVSATDTFTFGGPPPPLTAPTDPSDPCYSGPQIGGAPIGAPVTLTLVDGFAVIPYVVCRAGVVQITAIAASGVPVSAWSITATDAGVHDFGFTGLPVSIDANAPLHFTLTALDRYGNVVTGLTSVQISFGDPQSTIHSLNCPGTGASFTISMYSGSVSDQNWGAMCTPGTWTVTVTSGSVSTTSAPITVTAPPVAPPPPAPVASSARP